MKRRFRNFFSELFVNLPVPILRNWARKLGTDVPLRFDILFAQYILGINKGVYWPVHYTSVVTHPENIYIGCGTAPGLAPGCYIQGGGKVFIGDYTLLAPNVGIISANHNLYNARVHIPDIVRIGNYCWIGMNSTIMPGVILGDHTIVAANSVVTTSFLDGYVVLAGVPAKAIKDLEREKCQIYKDKYEYHGYIPSDKFEEFRRKKLKV